MSTDRKHSKLGRSIISLCCAAACVVGGFAMGSNMKTSAQAESAPAAETSSYVSPVQNVAANCIDSVVGVITSVEQWNPSSGSLEGTEAGEGSGVIISADGYIVTNNHVIANGTSYQVRLSDGTVVDATLKGADSSTDLAVLKIDPVDNMKVAEIGTSADLAIGETVVAIGNPGGTVLANTVTAGVVSALDRDVSANNFTRDVKTIQHDAAINPGNSGGALFDADGKLVGINTLKYTGSVYSSTSYEGLGFAIPIDTVMPIVNQLIENGKVLRPQMGVVVTNWDGPEKVVASWPPLSVRIVSVNEGGPADEAGLKANDFITAIDGVKISSMAELTSELDKHAEGDTVKLTVVRYDGIESFLNYYGYSTGASNVPNNGNSGNDGSYGGYYGNFPFGGYYGGGRSNNNNSQYTGSMTHQTLEIEVTLKILDK